MMLVQIRSKPRAIRLAAETACDTGRAFASAVWLGTHETQCHGTGVAEEDSLGWFYGRIHPAFLSPMFPKRPSIPRGRSQELAEIGGGLDPTPCLSNQPPCSSGFATHFESKAANHREKNHLHQRTPHLLLSKLPHQHDTYGTTSPSPWPGGAWVVGLRGTHRVQATCLRQKALR